MTPPPPRSTLFPYTTLFRSMDLQMPGITGMEATRHILQESPRIRILVVTLFEDDASVFTALRAGARGYILDRKSTRLNSSHMSISYAVFCLKKKKNSSIKSN